MGTPHFVVGGREYLSDLVNVLRDAFRSYRGLTTEVMETIVNEDEGVGNGLVAIAYVGNQAASVSQVVVRELVIGDSVIRVAGIANVGTKASFRGKGLATSLLKHLLSELEGRGYLLAALFAGEGTQAYRIYRRLGFEVLWRFSKLVCSRYVLTKLRVPEVPSESSINELTREYINEVSKAYESYCLSSKLALVTRRSRNYWLRLIRRNPYYTWFNGKAEGRGWILDLGGNDVTYLLMSTWSDLGLSSLRGNGAVIKEVICRDSRSCSSLLLKGISTLLKEGINEVVIDTPINSVTASLLKSWGCKPIYDGEVLMIKALKPRELSKYLVSNVLRELGAGVTNDGKVELRVKGVTYRADPITTIKLVVNALTPEEGVREGLLKPLDNYLSSDLRALGRDLRRYSQPYIWVIDRW